MWSYVRLQRVACLAGQLEACYKRAQLAQLFAVNGSIQARPRSAADWCTAASSALAHLVAAASVEQRRCWGMQSRVWGLLTAPADQDTEHLSTVLGLKFSMHVGLISVQTKLSASVRCCKGGGSFCRFTHIWTRIPPETLLNTVDIYLLYSPSGKIGHTFSHRACLLWRESSSLEEQHGCQ